MTVRRGWKPRTGFDKSEDALRGEAVRVEADVRVGEVQEDILSKLLMISWLLTSIGWIIAFFAVLLLKLT